MMLHKPVSALYRLGGTEPRPSSLIHTIDQDCTVVVVKGQPSKLRDKTGKLFDFPAPDAAGLSWLKAYAAEQAAPPVPGGNPQTFPAYAYQNLAGFGVVPPNAFACYMTGPTNAPASNLSDVLYYWIGLQDNTNHLFQPVLQSIDSETWNLQSYLVDGDSLVFTSGPSDTLPAGTAIQAEILNTSSNVWESRFLSEATGAQYPATVLNISYEFVPDETTAMVAFEAYAPTTDYWPLTTLFQWVALTAPSGINPTPAWSISEAGTGSTIAVTTPLPPINTEYPWRRNITITNTP